MSQIKIHARSGQNGRIIVDFSAYDGALVEKIKGISGRQWHPDRKVWSIPVTPDAVQRLQAMFGDIITFDPSLLRTIEVVTRRDIIDYLILAEPTFYGKLELTDFLSRIWDLSKMPSTDGRFDTAEGDIWQHMVNNHDWDFHYLFYTYLDILIADTNTFLKLLEQCVHPLVLLDPDAAAERVAVLNDLLATDGYILKPDKYVAGKPIYKAKYISSDQAGLSPARKYDVALSFAGEERDYVESVAQFLKDHRAVAFYDKYEEVDIWGKDLAEHLANIYGNLARFCVMFISANYARKVWPTYERRTAVAKAVTKALSNQREYILPARFDDTEVPGVAHLAYVDLRTKTPTQLGEMILKKINSTSE